MGSQNHFGCAGHGLGGVAQGFLLGKPAGSSTFRHGSHIQIQIGRSAAGKRAGSIHHGFLDGIHCAAKAHIAQKILQNRIFNQSVGTVGDHTLAYGNGGVGHDSDHRQLCTCKGLDLCHVQAGGHGDQQRFSLPENGCQRRQDRFHHLGLDAKKQTVTFLRRSDIVAVYSADLLSKGLCRAGAVSDHKVPGGD